MSSTPMHPMILAVRILLGQGPSLPSSRDVPEGLPLSANPPIPKASPGWSPSATCREGGEDTAGEVLAHRRAGLGRAHHERRET
jgi:hypothetical protein